MKISPSASPRPAGRPEPRASSSPGARSFLEVLREGGARAAAPPPSPPEAPPKAPSAAAPAAAPSPLARGLARVLQSTAAGETKLDAILDAAARGKTFTPTELLAMQATVFRYSQTVEVVSRAADRLVGAVKQTLGTQV